MHLRHHITGQCIQLCCRQDFPSRPNSIRVKINLGLHIRHKHTRLQVSKLSCMEVPASARSLWSTHPLSRLEPFEQIFPQPSASYTVPVPPDPLYQGISSRVNQNTKTVPTYPQ